MYRKIPEHICGTPLSPPNPLLGVVMSGHSRRRLRPNVGGHGYLVFQPSPQSICGGHRRRRHIFFPLPLSLFFSSSSPSAVHILKCKSHAERMRLALSLLNGLCTLFTLSILSFPYHTNQQHSTTFDIKHIFS